MSAIASHPQIDWRRFPWLIPLAAGGLVALGLSGIERAEELYPGLERFDRQVVWLLISLPVLIVTTALPLRWWKNAAAGLFLASLPLLVIVFWMPVRNGARCWIPLGWLDFQPSELAKLGYILALSQYLMYRDNFRTLRGLLLPFLLTLVPLGLILAEPDLGSATLFIPVLFSMLFAAGARPRHLAAIVCLGLACLPLFWLGMNTEQRSRITSFLTQQDGGPNPGGDGYQQHQSKLILSLGGTWGSEFSGPRLDDPDAYRLPAASTDFVFTLVGERWGFAGTSLTLLAYAILFAAGLQIAAATREPFARLAATGIVTLLAAQTIINTAMTVGLAPVTGITLPLMSYGGSSLLSTAVSLGLLIRIALHPNADLSAEPFRFTRSRDAGPRG